MTLCLQINRNIYQRTSAIRKEIYNNNIKQEEKTNLDLWIWFTQHNYEENCALFALFNR